MADIRNRAFRDASLRRRDRDPRYEEVPDPNRSAELDPSFNGRPVTREEVAYRDGYVRGRSRDTAYTKGRLDERHVVDRELGNRDNNNAARGLLLGIVLTSILAIVVGALFFFDRLNDTPEVVPVPVPGNATNDGPDNPAPTTNNPPVRERVIERVQEVVPIPQPVPQPVPQPAPQAAPPQPVAPSQSIQINPQPAPAQPQSVPQPEVQSAPQPEAQSAPTGAATEGTPGAQPDRPESATPAQNGAANSAAPETAAPAGSQQ